MRSLALKLTLAFLLVGLTGAFLVAGFVRYQTQREFDRLVVNQYQQALLDDLTAYYETNGSWAGFEAAFRPGLGGPTPNRGGDPRGQIRRGLFLIADSNGIVVSGGGPELIGRKLDSRDLNKGEPIQSDGQIIGWLIFLPAIDRWQAGTPEGNFLLSVNQATLFSALGATGVALILGGVLAYTLTRSLRELTAATKVLEKGGLGFQVKVRSRDELGELATSFNQMSSELERLNQLRRKMTADIAHDLRTPLSVIMGYTEALNDGKLEATEEIYAVLHAETLHLSHLVDDLKTLSLADAGELPLDYQPISPDVLVYRTATAHRVQAERDNIEIYVDIAPDLPEIEVDVERMMQVMGNLMSNALRYTPAGGHITLTALQEGQHVQLMVSDNGEGIPAEDLPYIFERSYRGDRARRHPEGESGLGLSISKSLIEAQGGTITVASNVGNGTTFTIQLPVSQENKTHKSD